ncbi:GNAT family N-acetyltransferase [Scrofimicrobium sp. R131]|uniref:GNAT family N-acetyltransferase n=1 Tax=Scrofimicrobium appendicitidis TaxID=3079930 RepID=A0AAU7V3T5_9ACTO
MLSSSIDLELFPAELVDGKPNPATANFYRVARSAFHGGEPSEENVDLWSRAGAGNHSVLTGAYDRNRNLDPAFAERPVGTFEVASGWVNVGRGRLLPAGLVTWVSVRPTHRRRGILREMMELNLRQQAEAGVPVAVLTASEAGIYSRFGFQNVYSAGELRLRTNRFKLRPEAKSRVQAAGSMMQVSIPWLLEHRSDLSAAYLRSYRGCVDSRTGMAFDLYRNESDGKLRSRLYAAVHLNERGVLDGLVSYRTSDGNDGGARVVELLAADPTVELALWDYLAHLDLIKEIQAHPQPVDHLLLTALVDQRAVEVASVTDHMWARVLDPVRTLRERAYSPAAMDAGLTITFEVVDPLGLAAGTFELSLDRGEVRVTRVDGAVTNLRVQVQALAALVFGAPSPTQLAAAGQIEGASAQVVDYLDAMFAPVGLSRCPTEF